MIIVYHTRSITPLNYQLTLSWQTKDTSDTHLVFPGCFFELEAWLKFLTTVLKQGVLWLLVQEEQFWILNVRLV